MVCLDHGAQRSALTPLIGGLASVDQQVASYVQVMGGEGGGFSVECRSMAPYTVHISSSFQPVRV